MPTNRLAVKPKKQECFKVGHTVARLGIVFASLTRLNQTQNHPQSFLDCTANLLVCALRHAALLGQSGNNFNLEESPHPLHCYGERAEARGGAMHQTSWRLATERSRFKVEIIFNKTECFGAVTDCVRFQFATVGNSARPGDARGVQPCTK